MKNPANSNMYEYTASETRERFAALLSGDVQGRVLVLAATAPSEQARNALEKSFEQLGYGAQVCTYACGTLEPEELFDLVEGLDPLVIVALDSTLSSALSYAYSCEVTPLKALRIFGRSAIAFKSFENLLGTPQDKQRAWAALKLLAR